MQAVSEAADLYEAIEAYHANGWTDGFARHSPDA